MKSRLVVGPPPIKYEKKYKKGGKLPKYQTGGTLANPLSVKDDPWEYAQEKGVVYTRKKGTDKWINLGSADSMVQSSSRNQMARTAILDKYGKQLGISQQKTANILPEVTVKPTTNTSTAQSTKQATPTKQVTPSKFTGNEEMVDIVARSLMTPEGQMKYRPAQGTATVTSNPIEYVIGGGAKLGTLVAKTLGQAIVNAFKYQEKRSFEKPYRDLQRSQKTRKENPYDEPLSEFLDKQIQGRLWHNKMQRAKAEKKAQSSLPKKQLGGMANVGTAEQAGLGLLTAGVGAIPGVGAILAPIVGALGGAMLQSAQKKNNFNRQYSNIQVAEKGGKLKSDPPVYVYDAPEVTVTSKKKNNTGRKLYQSTGASVLKFFDPTGFSSWPDVAWAYKDWQKGKASLGDVTLEAVGALPVLGKARGVIKLGKMASANKYQKTAKKVLDTLSNIGDTAGAIEKLPLKTLKDITAYSSRPVVKALNKSTSAVLNTAEYMQNKGSDIINKLTGISNKPIQKQVVGKKDVVDAATRSLNTANMYSDLQSVVEEKAKGGLIKRKDGSYSKRGLWDNIRANKGSGKKPTKEMLEQERKIKAKIEFGGMLTGKSDLSFYKGRKHANGGIMVSSKGTPSNKPVAEVEGGETRFKLGPNAYIFSDKLTL